MLESLNEHIKNNAPCYIERAIKPTFNWEDVIGLLQYSADSDVGTPIGILNYKLPDAHLIQGAQLVREYLNEHLEKKIANSQMCVTFSIRDNPSYKNDCDMLIWSTHGITEFSMGEEDQQVKRLLQPGDIVYVPEGLEFKMTPLNSRAFVSFGLEKVKDDNKDV